MDRKLAKKCAKLEVGWWIGHHRKDFKKVKKDMTKLYMNLFDMSQEKAERAIQFRIEAAKFHDLAEDEQRDKEKANEYWKKAEELLVKHFEAL